MKSALYNIVLFLAFTQPHVVFAMDDNDPHFWERYNPPHDSEILMYEDDPYDAFDKQVQQNQQANLLVSTQQNQVYGNPEPNQEHPQASGAQNGNTPQNNQKQPPVLESAPAPSEEEITLQQLESIPLEAANKLLLESCTIKIRGTYYCKKCSSHSTKNNASMLSHVRRHFKFKPFRCDQCVYKSSSKRGLHKHKKHHPKTNGPATLPTEQPPPPEPKHLWNPLQNVSKYLVKLQCVRSQKIGHFKFPQPPPPQPAPEPEPSEQEPFQRQLVSYADLYSEESSKDQTPEPEPAAPPETAPQNVEPQETPPTTNGLTVLIQAPEQEMPQEEISLERLEKMDLADADKLLLDTYAVFFF